MSFEPDWISPPGHTLGRLMRVNGIKPDYAGAALGGGSRLTDLLVGRCEINREVASTLADLVGGSQTFWLERERQYRSGIARVEGVSGTQDAELGWLKEIPVADMRSFGWIGEAASRRETVEACLRFFGVGSVPEWRDRYAKPLGVAAFRTSPTFRQSPGAVAAWLQAATIARFRPKETWSKVKLKNRLYEIRGLTRKKDPAVFLPALANILSDCGVSLAIAPAPSGCRASGATYFVDNSPVVALSFRHKTDDHLWFTVFHELGHLLLHDSRMIYIDDDGEHNTGEEDEADCFARSILIPSEWRDSVSMVRGVRDVLRMAKKIGIAPGILVGFMQHEGIISYKYMNRLKARYHWQAGDPQLNP